MLVFPVCLHSASLFGILFVLLCKYDKFITVYQNVVWKRVYSPSVRWHRHFILPVWTSDRENACIQIKNRLPAPPKKVHLLPYSLAKKWWVQLGSKQTFAVCNFMKSWWTSTLYFSKWQFFLRFGIKISNFV